MKMQREQLQAEDMVYELLTELGNLYLELGRYGQAIEKFNSLVELGESDDQIYRNLSKAYILKKQFDEPARNIFEKVISFDPDNELINKVLLKIYISEERVDEKAFLIYSKILNPQFDDYFENASKIISIAIQKDARDQLVGFLKASSAHKSEFYHLVKIYITESWKKGAFGEVATFLAEMEGETDDVFFSRLYIYNLIQQTRRISDFEVTTQDLELFQKYVNSRQQFDSFFDVYFFLMVNRFFQNTPIRIEEKKSNGIEEYELFLANDSFSNIWDLGLNVQNGNGKFIGLDDHLIWDKISEFVPGQLTTPGAKLDPEKRKEIFDTANSMMLIKGNEDELQIISAIFEKLIKTQAPEGKLFIGGIRARDGIVIFWKNITPLISMAENILKMYLKHEKENSPAENILEILIQDISLARGKEFKYLFDELETVLSSSYSVAGLLDINSEKDCQNGDREHRIVITSSVRNLLDEVRVSSLLPNDLLLLDPVSGENIETFRICWHDAIDKIRKGSIKKIGKYEIQRELHPNQIFSSFKAVDTMLERFVVLKVLKPGFEIDNKEFSTQEVFVREARNLGKFTDPNFAMVYEIGNDLELNFIAREFVEGEAICVPRKMNKKINWQKSVEQCIQISEILSTAHKKDLIHGRLKPENIFVINKNEIKLTDFQLADFCLPIKQVENISLKTLTYTAPELLEKNIPTVQTDIFALGVILYELLTDKNPFLKEYKEDIYDAILTETPKNPGELTKDLPEKLNKVVIKALEKKPAKRYASAQQFAKDLKSAIK